MVSLLRQELELDTLPPRKFTREDRFLLAEASTYSMIGLEDIVTLQVSGNYTSLSDRRGRQHLIRKSLTACAARLPAEEFFQTSRDTIVNLAHVKDVEFEDRRRLFFRMDSGKVIVLSTAQSHVLRRQYSF